MFIDNTRSELILGPDEDQEDQEDQGTSVAVATIEPKLKKPPLYRVVIFNDDYTPMEFVVYVLQTFFGIDRDKATQIMLAIHTHGKGVCGIFTKEVAETKSAQVNNFARENEHPLISEIEPVSYTHLTLPTILLV